MTTCLSVAASAVPRLIAVVVLPTPPFWLAMAMIRGACVPSEGGQLGHASRQVVNLENHPCGSGRLWIGVARIFQLCSASVNSARQPRPLRNRQEPFAASSL